MKRPVIFNRGETRNAILGSLSDDEAEQLAPHLRPVEMLVGEAFGREAGLAEDVIFPERGMLSFILDSAQNVGVEVGAVGREGVWDAMWALNGTPRLGRGLVQASGWGWSLPTSVLRKEFARGGTLQRQVLRYLELYYAQAAVTGVCNRLHTIEERLSRWLLIMRNGAESDEFEMENEFLACMLASRPSGVPLALGVLLQAGLIEVDSTHIRLIDVDGLHRTCCECHGILAQRLAIYLNGSTPQAEAQGAPAAVRAAQLCAV